MSYCTERTSMHNMSFNVAPPRKEMFLGADEHARRFVADAREGWVSSKDRDVYGGFHSHGGTQNSWFISWEIPVKFG